MEFGEFLFQKCSIWLRKKENEKSFEKEYFLSSCEKSLGLLIPYFLEDWCEVRSAKHAGASGNIFYFPPSLKILETKELNRALYMHLALMMAGAKKINLVYPRQVKTPFNKAFYLSQVLPQIYFEVDKFFPGFKDFQKSLHDLFFDTFAFQNLNPSQSFLIAEFKKTGLERSKNRPTDDKIDSDFHLFFKNRQRRVKDNEAVPEFVWSFWGMLDSDCNRELLGTSGRDLNPKSPSSRAKKKNQPETELLVSPEKEYVDLEKEKKRHNPVTHSFEKLETAEEYTSGFRTTDNSDQIAESENALRELNLKKVIRESEPSEAYLNSSTLENIFSNEAGNKNLEHNEREYFYPEYNYRNQQYKKDYCRLIETSSGGLLSASLCESKINYKEQIQVKHRVEITKFKKNFEQFLNERKWVDRQWEGPEIDLDSYVRYLTLLKAGNSSINEQLYLNQQKRCQDIEIMILVDCSLSTDSYVNNKRVIDVAMDSIGIMGCLLERTGTQISIALTSSESRHHCEFIYYKDLHEPWSTFYELAPQIVPKGYTRLGPALRHATEKLKKSLAAKKILLLLTDGKPTDIDGYEGRYGIEDMHQAVMSAYAHQIYVKAFAIEKEARHYFPHMFGQYDILPSQEQLPEALFKTYLQAIKNR
ncbi:MAG: VWA domain-containing protein [Pseudobdellovibrionaceae bacterium]